MFRRIGTAAAFLLAAGLTLNTGCKRSQPPEPVPAGEVAASLENAFARANPEIQSLVEEAAVAVRDNRLQDAFVSLQTLCARPDLTPDQREIATACFLSVTDELRAAAQQGDQGAADMMRFHSDNK